MADLFVSDKVCVPERELLWRFSRSGGPGGQSVNTSSTKVELSFDVASSSAFPNYLHQRAQERLADRLIDGVLTIVASEFRSQHRNRQAAEERLAALLREAVAVPPPKRRATRPTRSSVRQRLDNKKQRGETKRSRRRTDDD